MAKKVARGIKIIFKYQKKIGLIVFHIPVIDIISKTIEIQVLYFCFPYHSKTNYLQEE